MMGILSRCTGISSYPHVYFKYFKILFANYTSIKLKKTKHFLRAYYVPITDLSDRDTKMKNTVLLLSYNAEGKTGTLT